MTCLRDPLILRTAPHRTAPISVACGHSAMRAFTVVTITGITATGFVPITNSNVSRPHSLSVAGRHFISNVWHSPRPYGLIPVVPRDLRSALYRCDWLVADGVGAPVIGAAHVLCHARPRQPRPKA